MAFDTNLGFKIAAQVVGSDQIKGLTRDVTALRGSASGIEGAFKSAGNIIKGFAAAFAVREIVGFSKNIINLADGLLEASQRSGIAVESLSKLRSGAEMAGVSFESLQSGLKKLNVNLSDGATKGGTLEKAFEAVGIKVKDLKGLKTEDALGRIADAFKNTQDGANKVRIAVELFGKSGADLIPFLNKGKDGIDAFGISISEDFAKKADVFNDNLKKMSDSFKSLGIEVIGPLLNPVMNLFIDLEVAVKRVNQTFVEFKGLSKAIFSPLGDIKNLKDQTNKDLLRIENEIAIANRRRFDTGISATVLGKGNFKSIGDEKAGDKRAKEIKKEEDALKSYIAVKEEAIALQQLEAQAVNYSDTEYRKLVETQKFKSEMEKESIKYSDERLTKFQQEAAQLQALREKELALKDAREQSYGEGAKEALREYTNEAAKSAKMIANVFAGTFSRLEDSLVDFVKTGKLNFKELADYIITEMIRIQIRQAVLAPIIGGISSLFSGGTSAPANSAGGSYASIGNLSANGNIMTKDGPLTLNKYARGGIARSPQLSIFGEGSTPEAYVPLADGRSIPVSMKNSQSNASTSVSVVVNIDGSGEEKDTQSNSKFGESLGRAISTVVKQELIQQRRPGGLLST